MKKNYLILILFIVTISSQAFATFELARTTSPRGISLGNALAGEVDPINGILYNPASIAYSKQLQWQGVFGLNYTGLDTAKFNTMDSVLVVPFTYHFKYEPIFKNLVFGFSFNRLSLEESGSIYDTSDDFSYYEQMLTISFGKKLENIFSYGTLLSLGANINILSLGLSQNIDTEGNSDYFQKYNPMSFGLDIGATYYLNKVMVLGGVFENIIQPNVAFNSGTDNKLLPAYQLGLSWRFPKILFMNNVVALAQMTFKNWEDPNDIRKKPGEYHFGLEFWEFEKLLAVRLGYEMSQYGSHAGNSVPSLGIGVNKAFGMHEFQFDYSFQMPMPFGANAFVGTYGTHKFALTYNWSWPQSYFEFDIKKREELRQIEEMKKQYQEDQKKEETQKEDLKKDEAKTGNIESANDSPDVVMKKANQEQNTKLLELFTGYTKKRDSILAEDKKQKEEAAKQVADLDKQIQEESKKTGKDGAVTTTPAAGGKSTPSTIMADLTAKKDTLIANDKKQKEATAKQIADLDKQIKAESDKLAKAAAAPVSKETPSPVIADLTKKKDALLTVAKKQKEDTAKQTADIDKQITAENDKLAKAAPADKAKITTVLDDLKKKKDALVASDKKMTDDSTKQIADLDKQIAAENDKIAKAVVAPVAKETTSPILTDLNKKKDDLIASDKKMSDDMAKQIADLDKQIATENSKTSSATPADTAKAGTSVSDLNKKKDGIVTTSNKASAENASKIMDLKAETSKSMKEIQATYASVKKKFEGKMTANFKEEAPSVDMKAFAKDLEKAK